jgi:hypothetical protein
MSLAKVDPWPTRGPGAIIASSLREIRIAVLPFEYSFTLGPLSMRLSAGFDTSSESFNETAIYESLGLQSIASDVVSNLFGIPLGIAVDAGFGWLTIQASFEASPLTYSTWTQGIKSSVISATGNLEGAALSGPSIHMTLGLDAFDSLYGFFDYEGLWLPTERLEPDELGLGWTRRNIEATNNRVRVGGGLRIATPFGSLRAGVGYRWKTSDTGDGPRLIGEDIVVDIGLSAGMGTRP